VPAAAKVCDGFCTVDVAVELESPKFHAHDVGLPVDVSVKFTDSGAVPVVGDIVKFAVGAGVVVPEPGTTSACQYRLVVSLPARTTMPEALEALCFVVVTLFRFSEAASRMTMVPTPAVNDGEVMLVDFM
jgi:hypothetical protein